MEKDGISSLGLHRHTHTHVPMHMQTHITHVHTLHTYEREKYQPLTFQIQWLTCSPLKFCMEAFLGNTDSCFPLTEFHNLDGVTKDRAMQERPERRERKAESKPRPEEGRTETGDIILHILR